MAHIISIQSQVVHGHVGNSAAVPAMRALGATVTAVPTTLLSNHPHYPTMRGHILDAPLVADLLRGVEERGLIERAAVLVTGFLGSVAIGEAVADFVARARVRNPALITICDPVLGDDDLGGFADPALAALFRERLMPQAAVVTPNGWEARLIAGEGAAVSDIDLLHALRGRGLRDIVVTGGHASHDRLRTLILEGEAASAIGTPRLDVRPAGTGDFFTGVLAAEMARGTRLSDAAERAAALTFAILEHTARTPWAEMPVDTEIDALVRSTKPLSRVSLG